MRFLQEVPEDRCLRIAVPEWLGPRVEVIIKKAAGSESAPEAADCAQLQQAGGFLKGVLLSAHEDIWNEL